MPMRPFLKALSIALLLAPPCLRADATIRYKTDMTSAMPGASLGDSGSVIYMKGSKGVTVAAGETIIADFTKNEITIIDAERRKYATLPAAEYGPKMAEAMPAAGMAAQLLGSMKTTCESRQTGGTDTIQGVQAVERVQTCSMEMKLPEGIPDMAAAMSMKFVSHIWSAAPGERPRVPALWQLSGYELWQKYFMNPADSVAKMMPGMAPMMEDLQKDQSVVLRLSMEMFMKMPSMPGMPAPATRAAPMMKMTQEVVELSTAPLDDSLFQIPADCASATFGDVTNGLMQARIQAIKNPKPAATEAAAAVPAEVKAYVPSLMPLTQTDPPGPLNGVQGQVELLVTVNPKGGVADAEPLAGREPLRKPAVEAVRKWTFRPVIRNGAPVTAYTTTTVFFMDPKTPDIGALQADFGAEGNRTAQLEQAMPRSPQQVLADLEQDAGGGDSERRYNKLTDLTKAAMAADATEKAAAYANELLAAAKKDKKGWNYGNALHEGHATLGLVALRNNDVSTARRQLLEAGKTPGSPQLNSFGPDMTLANELLKKGERDTVLEYFTLCRSFWKMGTSQLDAWSATVREGETPIFGANLR